jgi:hypothetical protein
MKTETNRVASNLQCRAVSTNWTSERPCRLRREIKRSRTVKICQRIFTSEGEASKLAPPDSRLDERSQRSSWKPGARNSCNVRDISIFGKQILEW